MIHFGHKLSEVDHRHKFCQYVFFIHDHIIIGNTFYSPSCPRMDYKLCVEVKIFVMMDHRVDHDRVAR